MQLMRDFCLRALPSLKLSESPGEASTSMSTGLDRPAMRGCGQGLVSAYLVDQTETLAPVQNRHLQQAGLGIDELHRQALDNLGRMARARVQLHPCGQLYAVIMDGRFEASLILYEPFWTLAATRCAPGGLVAAFPARDLLFFGDAASPAAVVELETLCERTRGNVDHPISSRVYHRSASGWLAVDSPSRAATGH